ncbi:MAG: hypothetical protein ACYDDS_09825 [Candidatus Sulfotelmatobacter sp.]
MKSFKLDEGQQCTLRKTAFLFVLVSGVLIAADQLSIRCGLGGWQRILDDVLGGLIASSIFHWYEHRRLRKLAQSLHVIDLMNHHIRNALQPLMFVTLKAGAQAQMRVVEECVRHVDWTLREVLPGHLERELVVHNGGLARGSGVQTVPVKRRSAEADISQPEPHRRIEPFFNHWLDHWRSRNPGARQ